MKIVVLCGGISTEREISIISGEGVVRALIAAGRTREARLHYESYARKVIATLGVPPSARLRSLVNDACGREGDARSGKLEGMVYGGALPA